MAKLSDTRTGIYKHICVFGEPKSGKTTFISAVASIPDVKKVIWLSVDNGHGMLYNLPKAQKDKIDLIYVDDAFGPKGAAFEVAYRMLKGTKTTICDTHGILNCAKCVASKAPISEITLATEPKSTVLVIDHISQLASSAMNKVTDGKPETYKPEWPDYRMQGQWMHQLLTRIQNSKLNIVCTAQVIETVTEDGSKRLVPLIGTAPFSATAGGYFDTVVYAKVNKGEHQVGSSSTYNMSAITGDRDGVAIESFKGDERSIAKFFECLDWT